MPAPCRPPYPSRLLPAARVSSPLAHFPAARPAVAAVSAVRSLRRPPASQPASASPLTPTPVTLQPPRRPCLPTSLRSPSSPSSPRPPRLPTILLQSPFPLPLPPPRRRELACRCCPLCELRRLAARPCRSDRTVASPLSTVLSCNSRAFISSPLFFFPSFFFPFYFSSPLTKHRDQSLRCVEMASSGSGWWNGEAEEDASLLAGTTDVELLKQAWRNEKAAPEILQFQGPLVLRIREQIKLLEETVEEFGNVGIDDLIVSLYQMDLDRAQFLLRSYLRIRLQKIEKYMIHISKTDLWNKLSEQEQKFTEMCMDKMEKHLDQSVLSRLPYGYQSMLKQSISSEEHDMVPEPQLDTFVFCKTKDAIGALQLDNIGEEIVDLVADDLYIIRYKSIKGLVETGQIDLV